MIRKSVHGFVAIAAAFAVAILLIVLALSYGLLFSHPAKVEASTLAPINGYAWGEAYIDANSNSIDDSTPPGTDPIGGIGWIHMSCSSGWLDTSGGLPGVRKTCADNNFGLKIDSVTGKISGYAWSDHYGWVSANDGTAAAPDNVNDLAGCPIAPCSASISGGKLIGWLKVKSGGSPQSGGWDGFIALDDKNTADSINYGVTVNASGIFSGYGWGSTDVGWVSFSYASTTYNTCTPSTTYTCNGTQIIVRTDTDASCTPTVTNTTCVAPQFCSAGVPTCVTPQPTDLSSGSLTGKLTVKPSLVPKNGTTTVYWSVVNVQAGSCTVTAPGGTSWSGPFSATSTCPTKYSTGCTSPAITEKTTFTLSCLDFNSAPYQETATVNVLPDFQEQ